MSSQAKSFSDLSFFTKDLKKWKNGKRRFKTFETF